MRINRFVYILALVGALLYHAISKLWISWYLLVIIVCLPILSILLSLLPMIREKPVITAPGDVRRGDSAGVSCRCGRKAPLRYPPLCVLRLRVAYPGSDESRLYNVELSAGVSQRVAINTVHCTAVSVACEKAFVYDYLGLLRLRKRLPGGCTVLVRPIPEQPSEYKKAEGASALSYKPKPGGGFAEQYELREYRDGDSLRDVHWKLTAKTDRLIVREPQIADIRRAVVTLDVMPSLRDNDRVLDHLQYVSEMLEGRGVPHEVHWLDESESEQSATVADAKSRDEMLRRLLCARPPESGASLADKPYENADIRLHLSSDRTEV